MSSKIATVGQGEAFGKPITIVRINGNINKMFTWEQLEEFINHINELVDMGYKIVKEGQVNEL